MAKIKKNGWVFIYEFEEREDADFLVVNSGVSFGFDGVAAVDGNMAVNEGAEAVGGDLGWWLGWGFMMKGCCC